MQTVRVLVGRGGPWTVATSKVPAVLLYVVIAQPYFARPDGVAVVFGAVFSHGPSVFAVVFVVSIVSVAGNVPVVAWALYSSSPALTVSTVDLQDACAALPGGTSRRRGALVVVPTVKITIVARIARTTVRMRSWMSTKPSSSPLTFSLSNVATHAENVTVPSGWRSFAKTVGVAWGRHHSGRHSSDLLQRKSRGFRPGSFVCLMICGLRLSCKCSLYLSPEQLL